MFNHLFSRLNIDKAQCILLQIKKSYAKVICFVQSPWVNPADQAVKSVTRDMRMARQQIIWPRLHNVTNVERHVAMGDSDSLAVELHFTTPTQTSDAELPRRLFECRHAIRVVVAENKPTRERRTRFDNGWAGQVAAMNERFGSLASQ
jgi:hypothetical protein